MSVKLASFRLLPVEISSCSNPYILSGILMHSNLISTPIEPYSRNNKRTIDGKSCCI